MPETDHSQPGRGRRGAGWVVCVAACAGVVIGGAGGCDEYDPGAQQPVPATAVFGGLGDVPGRFAYPRCLEASKDSLWVIDKSARVQEIDPATGECLYWFRMPEWDLGKPTGFCVAPGVGVGGEWRDELLYIADTHYHRVMVYQPPEREAGGMKRGKDAPALVARFGEFGTQPGQFYYPTDVAVVLGADGKSVARVYVSEYGGNDRVSVFDGSFKCLKTFGKMGIGEDPRAVEFNRPQSIDVWERSDGGRELVVTDACNHRMGRFTMEGELIGWIGEAQKPGKELGRFDYPYGLFMLGDGTALVSEFGGCRVQRVDLEKGVGIAAWGMAGRGDGQLTAPWAVTALGASVWVLDSANNRLMAFGRPRAWK